MAEEQAHGDLGGPAPARLRGWGAGGELGAIPGTGVGEWPEDTCFLRNHWGGAREKVREPQGAPGKQAAG